MYKSVYFTYLAYYFPHLNAHYVAKHNKPFTEYTQLCKLDIAKDLHVGTYYVNRKGGPLLMKTISAVTSKSVVVYKSRDF
jgi:hypothetical protein